MTRRSEYFRGANRDARHWEGGQPHPVGQKAIALMVAQPSVIKRPVLDQDGKLVVGFKPEVYAKALG